LHDTRTRVKAAVSFLGPILLVMMMASVLTFFVYLSNTVVMATFFSEEEHGAVGGVGNAFVFILPAVLGGFVIALLFKYRKRVTLKLFFGGALFFAGVFITFFFSDIIWYVLALRTDTVYVTVGNGMLHDLLSPLGYPSWSYGSTGGDLAVGVVSLLVGFLVTFIIISRRFFYDTKNKALLVQGALMGAFLTVILPTWTVFFMLIGLALYDIYSVRQGPINDIVQLAMEEERVKNQPENNNNNSKLAPFFPCQVSNSSISIIAEPKDDKLQKTDKPPKKKREPLIKKWANDDGADADTLLSSMTYSGRFWDLGIGDLVFYSMLASHALSPYFIFNHGQALVDKWGFWGPWMVFLGAVVGISVGFAITIRMLEKNTILPGLPMSIFIGSGTFWMTVVILTTLG